SFSGGALSSRMTMRSMSLSGPASPRAADPNRITRSGRKYATTASSNSAGRVPVFIGASRRGSRREGGSGSCLLAYSQTQAGQQKLAVLRIPKLRVGRKHRSCDGTQPPDDVAGLSEPPHMGVAGGKKAVGSRVVGVLLDGEEQLRYCL